VVESALKYNQLSSGQIEQLTEQGCNCDDWSQVSAAEGFEAGRIKNVTFSGKIRLGVFEKEVSFCGGIKKPSGISNACIHNCSIGDNVYINNVRNYIANYDFEDDVVVENIDVIVVDGESSFGNGTEVKVLCEAGGREIPIFDELSSHVGYMIALYRHRPELIEKLKSMIADYTKSVTSDRGKIGRCVRILNCGTIKNVRIGAYSVVDGVNRLENGSLNSSELDPIYVGRAVTAENFIFCSGSIITDGVLLDKCFVGQGCVLGKQYSAENSVFFANCAGFHGEACSIFAGPYTVTHHKSTLLIAGLYSFLNAGSGSNQSNHLYKLGPVHEGVVERGSKTTSDSYILWPARVGAFTLVMGRHYRNSDTSDLPFSYLIEHEDESVLVPGVNLRSVGTVRDAKKWPRRDRRKDSKKLDLINFYLLSPYTIEKMIRGTELLTKLKITSGETSDYFTYHSVKIKSSSLDKGIWFYQLGINKYIGNCLLRRLDGKGYESWEELREILKADTKEGAGNWIDLAGLFVPQSICQRLIERIEKGQIKSIERLSEELECIHNDYHKYEWAWAIDIMQKRMGKGFEQITVDDIIDLVHQWKKSVVELDDLLYLDAKKEFGQTARTGFGVDGDAEVQSADFEAVRGSFEENSFVEEIEEHKQAKIKLGDDLISKLEKLL
jgi:hypothetical protein